MSGSSNSRSKSTMKTKSLTEPIGQIEQTEKRQDENEKNGEEIEQTVLMGESITPTILRRYKMPYRNFLRDLKIQMQNENLPNQELIKIASQRWKMMTHAEKEPYIQEAVYAKEIDAQKQKRNNKQSARKVPKKPIKKCPKCGGYPVSIASSYTTTEASSTSTESEEESENNNSYSNDSSNNSHTTETYTSGPRSTESASIDYYALKTSNRQKKRSKKAQKIVKRRKLMNSSSGSASYRENSMDNANSVTSGTAVLSYVSNYTSESL